MKEEGTSCLFFIPHPSSLPWRCPMEETKEAGKPTAEQTNAELARWGKQTAQPEEIRFLEGPQKRGFELWRAIRIFFELLGGFRALHFVGPCVTVFGSARFKEDHPYYVMA